MVNVTDMVDMVRPWMQKKRGRRGILEVDAVFSQTINIMHVVVFFCSSRAASFNQCVMFNFRYFYTWVRSGEGLAPSPDCCNSYFLTKCIFVISVISRTQSTTRFVTLLNRSVTVPLFFVVSDICFVMAVSPIHFEELIVLTNNIEVLFDFLRKNNMFDFGSDCIRCGHRRLHLRQQKSVLDHWPLFHKCPLTLCV